MSQPYVKKATIILSGYVREKIYTGANQMTKHNLIWLLTRSVTEGTSWKRNSNAQ